MKDLPSWKNQISRLRIDFIGPPDRELVELTGIRLLEGGKISTPMVYSEYRAGAKAEVREFRAASLFNSGMVLQRDRPIPVWGKARAGERVTVTFGDQSATVETGDDGKWAVNFAPRPASDRGETLRIFSSVEGHEIEFSDILMGDVWLCGGQSNMGGSPFDNAPPEERRKDLLGRDYPRLRYLSIPTLNRDVPMEDDAVEDSGKWRSVEPKTLAGVSAVSYYFGQALHETQGVPIGLVFVIKAGSQVEQWLSAEALGKVFSPDELKRVAGKRLATGLYNGMIAPLARFPMKGGLWYQGESNADDADKFLGYYRSLPALIREWRRMWGEDFPIVLAQLPAFNGYPPESWAHIREAQSLASVHLPRVGLAVSFDEGDPGNLHPHNKYFIGTRLALSARAVAYGESVEAVAPRLVSVRREGKALHLGFGHVGGGLNARADLAGFEVRGAQGGWRPAEAVLSGPDEVTLTCPEVPEPEAARYAWCNAPVATLFGGGGLPAGPFRTDVPAELIQRVKGN